MYLDMLATVEDNDISRHLPACYALVNVQYHDVERERKRIASLQTSNGGVLEIFNHLWGIAAGQRMVTDVKFTTCSPLQASCKVSKDSRR